MSTGTFVDPDTVTELVAAYAGPDAPVLLAILNEGPATDFEQDRLDDFLVWAESKGVNL